MNKKRFSWEYSYHDSTGKIYDWNRKECLITDYLQKYEIEEWCQELNDLVEERNYFEKKKCEYFNKWNLSHLDNIQLKKENKKLESKIKDLKFENEKKYRKIIQLEQMLQDVER